MHTQYIHSPQPGLSGRVLVFGDFAVPAIPSLNQLQHLKNERKLDIVFKTGKFFAQQNMTSTFIKGIQSNNTIIMMIKKHSLSESLTCQLLRLSGQHVLIH